MTTTLTEAPLHISCTSCNMPITDETSPHENDCQLSKKERKALLEDLGQMRIRAAAAAAEDEDEVAEGSLFICGGCDEEAESEGEIVDHQNTSGHKGIKLRTPEGAEYEVTIEAQERDVEVDGRKAKFRVHPLRGALDRTFDKPKWRDPQVPGEWVLAAQAAIDEGKIIVGGLTGGKKCPGKQVQDGVEVDCPHLTVMRSVTTHECELNKKHTETVWQMCLIHSLRQLAAGLAPAGNGPMFESAAQ